MNNKALHYMEASDEELKLLGLNRIERNNICILSKRARWLHERINENPDHSFDRSELSALLWAINYIVESRAE